MSSKTVYWVYLAIDSDFPGCVIRSIINYINSIPEVADLCTMETETLRSVVNTEYPEGEIEIPCGKLEEPIAGSTVTDANGKTVGYLDNFRATDCSNYPSRCGQCKHKHPETSALRIDRSGIHIISQTYFCDLLKKEMTEKLEEYHG